MRARALAMRFLHFFCVLAALNPRVARARARFFYARIILCGRLRLARVRVFFFCSCRLPTALTSCRARAQADERGDKKIALR